MSTRATPCRNCGTLPVVNRQKGRYPFVLTHPLSYTCPRSYWLESHQKTRDRCIADWNRHQERKP